MIRSEEVRHPCCACRSHYHEFCSCKQMNCSKNYVKWEKDPSWRSLLTLVSLSWDPRGSNEAMPQLVETVTNSSSHTVTLSGNIWCVSLPGFLPFAAIFALMLRYQLLQRKEKPTGMKDTMPCHGFWLSNRLLELITVVLLWNPVFLTFKAICARWRELGCRMRQKRGFPQYYFARAAVTKH